MNLFVVLIGMAFGGCKTTLLGCAHGVPYRHNSEEKIGGRTWNFCQIG